MDVYKKNIDTKAQSILTTLNEQEIFLLRPCRNFAPVKEGFIECLYYALVKNKTLETSHRDVIATFKAG